MQFSDRVALVTGGASGIGAAVVGRLIADGASVVVFDLTIDGAHPEAFAVEADVSDSSSVRAAMKSAMDHFGRLDIVVNNAGIGAQGSVERVDDGEWARVLNVNVTGMARITSAALPYLRLSDAAAVVNVSSIAATAGLPDRALYSASKGAVLALTRAMAADHLSDGIRVNCVNPGTADTPWVSRLLDRAVDPAAERAALAARQPHGRLVSPQEIAEAIVFLAGHASASTTGTSIAIDGGMQELRLRPVVR